MTRELMVLRHGKSDWNTGAARDFDRPLNKRGRKAVKRMGAWILERDLLPDRIVSSPATRARETALRLCRSAGLPESVIAWDERIYEAELGDLLSVLRECAVDSLRLMIVGHNPGLEELVLYLSDQTIEAPGEHPLMPTAALALFEVPDDWSELEGNSARLVGITRPRELKAS